MLQVACYKCGKWPGQCQCPVEPLKMYVTPCTLCAEKDRQIIVAEKMAIVIKSFVNASWAGVKHVEVNSPMFCAANEVLLDWEMLSKTGREG